MGRQRTGARKVKTTLSLDPAVRARICEFAAGTSRTLTASVEMLCTEALDARQRLHARRRDHP